MRWDLGRVAVFAVVACRLGLTYPVRADEPNKPTASATEKNPAVPAAGHSIHGEAFDDGPRQAAYLMSGMGKVSFPVTTKKPEAQAFINQGVAQLHSFFYFEAERSFRQAVKIDPDCAMGYWGVAMANVNNSKRARGFLKEARKRGATLTRRETLYIDALEPLHKDGAGEPARKKNHLAGLGALVHEFPNDVNAVAWLAMVNWQNGNTNSREMIDFLLESVLQLEPVHPGAHHYRIHLWDEAKPAWGEKSAAIYGKTAPGIAHAWHMPGHIYTDLKRFADAAYQQEASARVDHSYMIRDRVMPFEIHNYAHNNQWLVTSLGHVGRARDAVAVARNLVEQPRDPNKNGKNDGGSPQRNGRLRWSEILTRFELWDDLIAATESGAIDWSDVPAERKQRAYTLGLAYASKKDAARLAEQIAALKALKAEDDKSKRDSGAPAAIAELEGYELLARGDFKAALERFGKASSMRPESLARARLAAHDEGLAVKAANDAVSSNPGQVSPLAAKVEILNAVGKVKEAQDAYRLLAPLARFAERDLPVFQRLAPVVAAWKAEKAWVEPIGPPTDELTVDRPDLATLGPLGWSPFPAPALSGEDTKGGAWSLGDHKGRNVVVLFYLGGKCAHCMQQLTAFGKEIEALKALKTDLVAVSTDDRAATTELKQNKEGVAFPMPLLSDPSHDLFKRFRSYDDFDDQPLHGTFLIDPDGNIRYQRVSSEPFLDTDFIKAEAARVDRLLQRPADAASREPLTIGEEFIRD